MLFSLIMVKSRYLKVAVYLKLLQGSFLGKILRDLVFFFFFFLNLTKICSVREKKSHAKMYFYKE